ncbi:hypothetical protein MDV080.5 [Gallid alphaherpesvirus 2]|uniref:Uncharacterized protein n=1 Tax=Gallid alphaherpesvirus 2 TaxID=10390 RepID=B4YEK7_9ALPH|nr:hypothetical protein MDV080.5 [Gallid alphaherpesvirus 2]ADA83414.1 hypothetical protein [Gallid alphaherpesvirus 2]QOJ42096.1 hypothetical protein [synthetic construct]QOJ42281.1 hypothetical protein [synthetic construct]QOJ42465.1 hypothetical protein [synthetic construct]
MEQGYGLRTGCSNAGRCTTVCRPREVLGPRGFIQCCADSTRRTRTFLRVSDFSIPTYSSNGSPSRN